MRAILALLLLSLMLAPIARAQPPRPGGSAPPSGAASRPAQPAALPPGQTTCDCEQIPALQQELRNALKLRDRHAAMASELEAKFGATPRGAALREAREAYLAFETGTGPNSASAGIIRTVANAPPAISYIPRGQAQQEAHARDSSKGIPLAERWTADGRPEPDLDLRRQIEAEQRAKNNDLCEFENRAAIERSATAGASCAAIAQTLVAHEESHRATCRRVGYYAFAERPPAALAADEVTAYDGQIRSLTAELSRLLKLHKTKIIAGSTGTREAMLEVKIRCALALNVVGQIDDLSLRGKVCDTAETFRIPTSPEANMVLTPRDKLSGAYAYRGTVAGAAEFWGSGGYTISLENGQGILTLDGAGQWWARNPVGTASKGGPERLRVSEIKEGC